MKTFKLNEVNQLLKSIEYESIELHIYTDSDNINQSDLSEFHEVNDVKNLKQIALKIKNNYSNLHHIDFVVKYEDSDFDQITIYKK